MLFYLEVGFAPKAVENERMLKNGRSGSESGTFDCGGILMKVLIFRFHGVEKGTELESDSDAFFWWGECLLLMGGLSSFETRNVFFV